MSVLPGPITLSSQWNTARKNLAHALSAFSDASTAMSGLDSQRGRTRESILQIIAAELPALQCEGEMFFDSLNALKRLRNTSTALVPINRLPREILAAIFSVATDHIRTPRFGKKTRPRDTIGFVNVLSSVCSVWRHTAVATPALWAHVDFDLRRRLDYQALWLERAANHPLHLRFLEVSPGAPNWPNEVFDLLISHYPQCNSLVVNIAYDLTQQVLHNACVSNGDSSSSLESLTLFAYGQFVPCFSQTQTPSKDQLDRFLGPVRSLHLSRTSFDNWTSAAFHGLVDLSLDSIQDHALPTCDELVQILRASPNLFSLKLAYLIFPPAPLPETGPIILEQLAILSLRFTPGLFTSWLLKSLMPRRDGFTLSITGHFDPYGDTTIGLDIPFLAPNRVKALYINCPGHSDLDLSKLLVFLPCLETLALQDAYINSFASTASNDDLPLPKLRTLDLISCPIFDPYALEAMLVRHSVSQLVIVECKGAPSVARLLERIPGLVVREEPRDIMEDVSPFGL